MNEFGPLRLWEKSFKKSGHVYSIPLDYIPLFCDLLLRTLLDKLGDHLETFMGCEGGV